MDRKNHKGFDKRSAGLTRAIKIAGGQAELARLIGTSQSTISHWLNKTKLPGEFARIVHEKTGVPLRDLRPDLWP